MIARDAILSAFAAALEAADPEHAVTTALARPTTDTASPVWCLAVGKAAAPMLAGAIATFGDAIQAGFLITKDGHIDRPFDDRFQLREAAHPVLDERTVTATGELLDWVRQIPPDDRVIVLLSGGGSALLERPVDQVPLDAFQELTRTLLNAGADIYQLNCVRSQVSLVKGGQLRAAIPAIAVETLALSDVLGNDRTVIASGPTVAPTRTRADALAVIEQLGVVNRVPPSIMAVLAETETHPPARSPADQYSIIADNQIAISAAANHLEDLDYSVQVRDQIESGEARSAAGEWVASLSDVPDSIDAVVSGGELTVTVTGAGTGGRNTEFALAAARALHVAGNSDWTIASLATDGQDALTGFAGAIVDSATWASLEAAGLDADLALRTNDSATALAATEATVFTGPTGTNVNDLFFAIRNRPA